MNILVVAHYQNNGYPSAIFVHNQVLAYRAMGHRVRVLVPVALGKRGWDGKRVGFGMRRMEIDGVEHVFLRYLSLSRYGEGGFNAKSAILMLKKGCRKLLHGFTPDVIHAHTLGFDSELGAWLKEYLGRPLVVTTHGSDVSIPYQDGRLAWLQKTADRADMIVAVSSRLKQYLAESGTKTKIRVICNGFKLPKGTQPVEKTPYSLIQVGNLIPQKQTDVTIRAFAKLLREYPEAVLTIIGQGPEQDRLKQLCRDLKVIDKVRFLGQVSNDTVLAEMAKSQFFVMPSIREGFGIVYLEAMASGCITVGTVGEGIADLIRSGENGYLVPPGLPEAITDVVAGCIRNPQMAARLTQRGRLDAMTLTWERNAKTYLELFKELDQ